MTDRSVVGAFGFGVAFGAVSEYVLERVRFGAWQVGRGLAVPQRIVTQGVGAGPAEV